MRNESEDMANKFGRRCNNVRDGIKEYIKGKQDQAALDHFLRNRAVLP